MSERIYCIHVYAHQEPKRILVLGYTRASGRPGCMHIITADNWSRATRAAEKEHRRRCLPVAGRVVTHPDGHNAYPSPGRTAERVPCDCPLTILPVPPGWRLPLP